MKVIRRVVRWLGRVTPGRLSFYIMVLFLGLYIYKERHSQSTLNLVETKAYDFRFRAVYSLNHLGIFGRFFAPRVSERVVIAAIDNRTLEFYNWPFPRGKWAEFLRKIEKYQPAVVAFDVVFETVGEYEGLRFIRDVMKEYESLGLAEMPAELVGQGGEKARQYVEKVEAFREFIRQREREADQDRLFADELARHNNVVLGYFSYASKEEAFSLTREDLEKGMALLASSAMVLVPHEYTNLDTPAGENAFLRDVLWKMRFQRLYGFRPPIEILARQTRYFGNFVADPDPLDGTIRRAPMAYIFTLEPEHPTLENTAVYTSLSLETLRVWYRSGNPRLIISKTLGVKGIMLDEPPDQVKLIPTDEKGRLMINWMGPAYITFPHISVYDIITDFQNPAPGTPKIDPVKMFKDKIVLVGSSATGAHDMRTTPFGAAPGVEMHANVISNILEDNTLVTREWFRMFDLLFILAVGLLFGLVLPRLSALRGGLVALIFFVGYILLNLYLFIGPHYSFTIIFPLSEILSIYLAVTLFRYATEEKEKRFIKHTFEHYLSPAVIEDLMKDPRKLKLGGERKELTAFFSDIQGFSSFSENMEPEQLVHFLNLYLTEMCDIILKYDGTIDKFEGDAIIAFFGAPINLPDHASRACLCAADIQKRMVELRKKWKEEGWPEVHMRIGLNSGPMVVGNMGSRNRFDYTVMGDAVNLASRLEGGAKAYRVYTIISEDTRLQAGDVIECRELDVIRVKGKEKPVKVFELLGRKGEVDPKKLEVARLFVEGLRLYRERYWSAAMTKFLHAIDLDPHDGPSHVFVARCEEFSDHPPGPDWDGVYTMTTK